MFCNQLNSKLATKVNNEQHVSYLIKKLTIVINYTHLNTVNNWLRL